MNARKSKAIRRKALTILYAWFKTLISEEEASKIKPEEILEKLPKTTHYFNQGSSFLSAWSYKWVVKKIKKALKNGKTLDLSLININEPTRPRLISYSVFCLKKK